MNLLIATVALAVVVQGRGIPDEARIFGGQIAFPQQFPHQVALTVNSKSFCGGSLIHPKWVLTAAHCVQGSNYSIRVGSNQRQGNDPNSVTLTSSKGIPHEGYQNPSLHNDIALIELRKPIVLNQYIQTVKLSEPDDYIEPDTPLTVSGFGTTELGSISPDLKYANLTSITNKVCADYYEDQDEIIYKSTLCCQNQKKESTCFGDSGGPLVKYDNWGVAIQVGVVSFVSNRGCGSGDPSGYVRTSEFRDWIKEKTNGDVA